MSSLVWEIRICVHYVCDLVRLRKDLVEVSMANVRLPRVAADLQFQFIDLLVFLGL